MIQREEEEEEEEEKTCFRWYCETIQQLNESKKKQSEEAHHKRKIHSIICLICGWGWGWVKKVIYPIIRPLNN